MKTISDIEIGDRILSATLQGKTSFATVIAIPHGKNSWVADFSHIVSTHHDVKMTPSHLVLAGECGREMALIKAADVEAGACIMTADRHEKVLSNEIIQASGLYTLVTDKELIVVNGIIASPFAVSHRLGNVFYSAFRAIHMVFPAFLRMSWLKSTLQSFSSLVMAISR